MNVPRIKGSHNAVLSGHAGGAKPSRRRWRPGARATSSTAYENGWRDSAIGQDLKRVRNVKPLWSRYGTLVGVGLGGLDMWSNTLLGRLALRHAQARQAGPRLH